MTQQLALGLELDVAATFDGFLPQGNAEAVTALRRLIAGVDRSALWLCGPSSCGKSHLLQASCRAISERGGSAMYVPLARADEFDPQMLRDLEAVDLLAVDDIDRVAGSAQWEAGLFALINERLHNAQALVVAAGAAPRDTQFALADLQSRASAHVVYRLLPPDEAALEALVRRRARERGLRFDERAIQYFLSRSPRDMRVLDELLAGIDRRSLVAQRRVTVALVREVLSDANAPG